MKNKRIKKVRKEPCVNCVFSGSIENYMIECEIKHPYKMVATSTICPFKKYKPK